MRPQQVRSTLTQIIKPGRPFLVRRNESAELAALRLSNPVRQVGCDPSGEPFAPYQRIRAGKARHPIVGHDQPQSLDTADLWARTRPVAASLGSATIDPRVP